MDVYMSYKVSRLQKYAQTIMHSYDDFLSSCLYVYFETYINCYYYCIFDTSNVMECTDNVIKEELEGRRLELLADLANYELVDSNEEYALKKLFINNSINVVLFVIGIDRLRYSDRDDVTYKVNSLLEYCPSIKAALGTTVNRLISLIKETYSVTNSFFKKVNSYYFLEYGFFKNIGNYAVVKLDYKIKNLDDNYKKSLVERVYRNDKLLKEKTELLIKHFIKQFISEKYNNKLAYDKYFIELKDELTKEDLKELLDMLNNQLLKKYIVIVITSNTYKSNQALFNKYKFSMACNQDFSHINDVKDKLGNIDMSNVYDYIIVSNYKANDYNDFMKYTKVNLTDILFNEEV